MCNYQLIDTCYVISGDNQTDGEKGIFIGERTSIILILQATYFCFIKRNQVVVVVFFVLKNRFEVPASDALLLCLNCFTSLQNKTKIFERASDVNQNDNAYIQRKHSKRKQQANYTDSLLT